MGIYAHSACNGGIVMTRSEARKNALELLFEREFRQDESNEEIFATSVENREIETDPYIKTVFFGVCENVDAIDEEINKIITESYNEAKRLLTENIDKLHFVAKFLHKYEVMDSEQFRRAMEEDEVTFEELEEMVAERTRRSEAENAARAIQIAENERLRAEERAREEAAKNGGIAPEKESDKDPEGSDDDNNDTVQH